MGLYKGYKLKEVTKSQRLEVRMTEAEAAILDHCSKELNLNRTQVLLLGLEMVKKSIKEK